MRTRAVLHSLLFLLSGAALGQTLGQASGPWVLEKSGTTAGLRGIHAVGGGVAWASGTNGTVLRTEDGGYEWQSCAMPPGAEKLDFRGIWAWDANTAIVMSSGTGDLSRLYKTTDGCSSWKLLFTNPDKDGFWDGMVFSDPRLGFLIGDPVGGQFYLAWTTDGGTTWRRVDEMNDVNSRKDVADSLNAGGSTGAFAASNSSLALAGPILAGVHAPWFGTGGPGGAHVYKGGLNCTMGIVREHPMECFDSFGLLFQKESVPVEGSSNTSGIFSLAVLHDQNNGATKAVAVGGDYTKPGQAQGTAAFWTAASQTWTAAAKPPHGFRSAVEWDADLKAWIAAGTNGSDISWDDGKTWEPVDDGNWNALSLPWVVGPKGQIAKLDAGKVKK
jgi:hypothetical protein